MKEGIQCSKALLAVCQEDQQDFFDRLIEQDETWVTTMIQKLRPSQNNWSALTHQPKKGTCQICRRQGHNHCLLGPTWSNNNDALLVRELQEAFITKRRRMLTKGVRLLRDNAVIRFCGYDILPLPWSHFCRAKVSKIIRLISEVTSCFQTTCRLHARSPQPHKTLGDMCHS